MYDFCFCVHHRTTFETIGEVPAESLHEDSGSKNSGFEKDVESLVEKLYGKKTTKTQWVVKNITAELYKDAAFWERWNHVDHLCTTANQLSAYIHDLKVKKIRPMDDSDDDVED